MLNFLSTIKAIFQLIKKMGCNYISLFYDNNSYSLSLKNDIKALFEATKNTEDAEICINKFIKFEYNDQSDDDEFNQYLDEIFELYDNEKNIEDPVIVYLGYSETYSKLVEKLNVIANDRSNINNIHLVSSEAANKIVSKVSEKIKLYQLSLKTFDMNEYVELNEHYKRILQSFSSYGQNIPWINEYIMIKYNCSLLNNIENTAKCNQADIDSFIELPNSQYLTYLIYSMAVFFEQLKTTCVSLCPVNTNINDCKKLSDKIGLKKFTDNLRNVDLSLEYYQLIFEKIRV
jgi:hypothetical protein